MLLNLTKRSLSKNNEGFYSLFGMEGVGVKFPSRFCKHISDKINDFPSETIAETMTFSVSVTPFANFRSFRMR